MVQSPPSTANSNNSNQGSIPNEFYKHQIDVKAPKEMDIADIREIRVEESLYEPCRFSIVIDNPYGPGDQDDTPGKYTDAFGPNENWEIRFTTSRAEPEPFMPKFTGRVFAGKSFKVSTNFDRDSQGRVTVSGYDELALLAEGIRHRTFTNTSHKDIVTTIAREVGITIGKVEDTGITEEYICQADETNLQFLSKLAAMNGFELFVQCEEEDGQANGLLYFRKPTPSNKDLELKWGENIRAIRPRYKKLQVNYVDVPYWKYKEKRIDGTELPRKAGSTPSEHRGLPADEERAVYGATYRAPGSWNTNSLEKTNNVALSICNQYEGQFLCAEMELEGNADIRPGHRINIVSDNKSDLKRFNGVYYVTDTCHIYEQGRFKTLVTVSDTGGYSLFQHNFSPVEKLRPGQTHLVGIVTNNKDDDQPPNMGCVKVRFPTLRAPNDPQGIESCWARVVTTGAGKDRGIDWLPEIGDEVVVAFEHGDIHRPYIIGSVWNGVDYSPEDHKDRVNANGVRLRTLKTRVGHEIEFVEEDGRDGKQRGIYIKTADKLKIEMNDTKKEILIHTPNGMKVQLSDMDNTIKIQAGPGGGRIRLDSAGVHINGLF
jgi:phage protein D